ncbi:hypothetical protein JJB09_26190 [Rhizobium sp. KVB221]|uniref:DUF7674 domain-containing protein n=1 Tax=Rhizobium setariae TaxID=2801340 RepID=A0A937CRY0_9HYPH|nr:hypothetical protein [Rhizobium setariae]
MIISAEMFPLLLLADPTFEQTWTTFLAGVEDGKEPLYYQLLGDLAVHLARKLQNGETQNFTAVFRVIEDWHVHGDDYVRTAASIGFLEDLQNENLHEKTKPSDFEAWLLPESKRWWNKIERFWENGEPIVAD